MAALERTVNYADRYHDECEAAEYSDTSELWAIIKMFSGIACSIIDQSKG